VPGIGPRTTNWTSTSPWLSNLTVQPGPSRSTIEIFCFGTAAKAADFSILPDAVSRPRMHHRPSSTQSEAEPIFRQQDVHLLMTDIRMPGSLDGVVLADLARGKKPHLPVIFLSGNLDGLANSDRLAPPSAFLVKPVDMNDAIDTIDLLMSGDRGPTDVIHNRAATQRPTGTPTSDRHKKETTYTWEDEDRPVLQPGRRRP
jgi:CheY-like chemotaxis protein